ncbi:hypothetical protein TSMEX_006042, partial [Taenia solium]
SLPFFGCYVFPLIFGLSVLNNQWFLSSSNPSFLIRWCSSVSPNQVLGLSNYMHC